MSKQTRSIERKGPWQRLRSTIAGVAVTALTAGMIVVAGLGIQSATANEPAPGVSVSTPDSYIWGEDLPITISFTGTDGAGAQYNTSAGVVLPADATVIDTGTLGAMTAYTAGTVLPGVIVNTPAETCVGLGLENAPSPAGACRVPAGKQYLVFENIQDLPQGATASHTLTVRPNAATFEIGTDFPVQVNGYTNGDERYLPVFPGSTGLNTPAATAKSSNAGSDTENVVVNGLRITKNETTHAENEVLRGVHGDHGAIYELRIEHTGEADLSNARVVDYLPAGLEYLGSCDLADSTENANGTQGAEEYSTSGPLNVAAPGDIADCFAEESIETVQGAFDDEGNFVESADGDVFTKVTWNVGSWLRTNPGGLDQSYPSGEGTAAATTIRYRAGIPLYENTMDFGVDAVTLGATGQGANLDNNRGASTRHGTENLDATGAEDGAAAKSYTNHAIAAGEHDGAEISDSDTETIDAVDVRVYKTVNGGEPGAVGNFTQGETVRYGIQLATSEYMSAVQGDPTADAPLRIVDEMADGLCPVFGPGTQIWGDDADPLLKLGDGAGASIADAETWNAALTEASVDTECQWDTSAHATFDSETADAMSITGQIVSITFSPATGKFSLEIALADENALNAADSELSIEYSVRQNTSYIKGGAGPDSGATTSRDVFENRVEIEFRTTPIDAITGVGTPGMSEDEQARLDADWNAWDDSSATMQAGTTSLSKKVLERGDLPLREDVSKSASAGGPDSDRWVDAAEQPFAVGDETWYRIVIDPPSGADVRNPVFTDFLPQGVSFDSTTFDSNERYQDLWVVPSVGTTDLPALGSCDFDDVVDWLNAFAPTDGVEVNGNVLTFNLGAKGTECGVGGDDRFLPFESALEIYIKVTVTDPSAFAEVDLPQNLAKYQQENNEGEIFFLRDDATIEVDRTAKLLKGVASVKANGGSESSTQPAGSQDSPDGTNFNSNRDRIEVVQGDEVTYRLDVTAPYNDTTGYSVWDVLPVGIKAADVVDGSYTAKLVESGVTGDDATFEAQAYDYPYTAAGVPESIAAQLKATFKDDQRSVIVWSVTSVVPGSSKPVDEVTDEDGEVITPAVPAIERGVTLGYTVVVPDGTEDEGGAAALIGQSYDNDASIVEFDTVNNGSGDDVRTTAVIVDGSESVADPREPSESDPGYVFVDERNDTSDASNVYLPNVEMAKELVNSQINGTSTVPQDQNNAQSSGHEVIVEGELATFDYTVTLPANTTVREGVLFDLGDFVSQGSGSSTFKYQFESAELPEIGNNPSGTDVENVTADPSTPDTAKFLFNETNGKLFFPEYYQSGASDETFTVRITVWTSDNASPTPNLGNNTTLRNTAVFESKNLDDSAYTRQDTDYEDVVYREPNLRISKAAESSGGDTSDVNSDDIVTYALTVTNDTNRVKSYDNTVVDTVPVGLLIQPGSFKVGGATVADGDLAFTGDVFEGEGGTITWTYSDVTGEALNALAEIPSTVELTYTAKIDPTTGASTSYRNDVTVTGYTLPASLDEEADERRGTRTSSANETITATTADITKGVRVLGSAGAFGAEASAPIGQTVEYQVVATLEPHINYYNVELVDEFAGSAAAIGSPVRASVNGPTASPSGSVPGNWTLSQSGRSATWTIDNGGSPHIVSATDERTLTLTYRVTLTDEITVDDLPNDVSLSWTKTSSPTSERDEVTDEANVDVLDPVLAIAKDVKFSNEGNWRQQAEGNADRTLNYQIVVTNTGETTSYQNVIVDTLPGGVVNPRDFKINGVAVSGANTAVVSEDGSTVTWTMPGGLLVGADNARTLSYTADFADADYFGESTGWQRNVAKVSHYESWPRTDADTPSGRQYDPSDVQADAEARPLFPSVTPTKTVTTSAGTNDAGDDYGIAYEGEPFGWTLTLVNSGAGAAQTLDVTDVLPANWEYLANSAQVRIGTQAVQQIEPTVTPATGSLAVDGQQTLVWELRDADAATPLLPGTATASAAAARTVTITFQAVPNEHALDNAGTGIVDPVDPEHPHTNTLSAVTTDTRGDTGNKDGSFTGSPDTADAHIAEADLLLVKEAIGGIVSQATSGDDVPADNLYELAAGTWVAGQGVVTDQYAQPQWQITVNNHGPDDSYGPFTFTDTVTAPTGVLTGQWTATYFPTAADAAAGTNAVNLGTFSGLPAGSEFKVGDETTVLGSDGDARIVLTADVTIPAGATATAEQLSNIATVDGRTFEQQSNKPDDADNPNTDEADKPLTTLADLTIDKTVNTASPNVGSPITWGITVTNLGPSVSKSPADEPITVTDTVPEGMTNVTVTQNADWVPVITREGVVVTGAAEAGDVVTWTYQKAQMPVGTTAEVTMSGVIVSSHTGELSNTATVHPTVTPEPEPNEPNEDTETTTPGDDTTLGIEKTRVVNVDGAWVNAVDMEPTPPHVAGESISYRIEVTNTGRADARTVTVVDEVPVGLEYSTHVGLSGSSWDRAESGTNAAGTTDATWDTFSLETPATLAAGAKAGFVVTYDTASTVTGDVVNWSEASAENSTNDPRDPDNSGSTRKADLGIVKSHTSPAAGESAVAGESVDYRLVVTNHGPSDSSAPINVIDELPDGFSYREGSASISIAGATAVAIDPEVDGQTLTWEELTGEDGDLSLGSTIVIDFTADIDPSVRAQTGLLNTADVEAPEDTNPENNHSEDPVDIVTSTDMVITKTVEDGPWIAGTDVEYELTIRNNGPSAAPATVLDTLPLGLTMVSMDGTGWDCDGVIEGAQTGSCEYTANDGLHPVGADAETTIIVVAHIASNAASLEQPLNNEALLTWTDSEGSHEYDDDEDITVTRSADLGIVKTALDRDGEETTTVIAGTSLWYRLLVSNAGPSDAIAPLVLNDTLPAGMTFVGLSGESAAGWSAVVDESDSQRVVFTRTAAGILSGESAPEVVFEVAVDPSVPVLDADDEPNVLTNSAELDEESTLAPNGDPESGDELPDSDTADVVVERQVDLGIVKSHDADRVRIGDVLPFTIDVTNHGPSEVTGIVVTDEVPAGLEVVSQLGPVFDENDEETGWEIVSIALAEPGDDTVDPALPANPAGGATVIARYADPLAPGDSATPLVIDTLVTAAAYETVTNLVDVTANEPEPDPDTEHPNFDEDQVVVPPMVTLVVEKTAIGEFKVGKVGTYQIVVTNLGPTADPGPITVTDALPRGLGFNSSPDEQVAHSGGVVTWTLPDGLAVGESTTLTLKVNVLQAAYDQPGHELTNIVVIDSPAEKTPDSVLSDDATVTVKAADPLVITGGDLAVGLLVALLLLLLLGAGIYLAGRGRQRARHA